MKLACLALMTLPLAAEFRVVDIGVGGLDCASCASSVERVLGKIRGVESASYKLDQARAVVKLKPGNHVPLEDIRDALKRIGYTPGDAQVEAVGDIAVEGGKARLTVTGPDQIFPLEVAPADKPAAGQGLIIEGTVPARADRTTPDVLKVRAIRRP